MTAPKAAFVRMGLCTPLGLDAAATQAAIGAGLSGFTETEVLDESDEPLRASRLDLESTTSRTARMIVMARRALKECLSGLRPSELPTIECLLALPQQDGAAHYDAAAVLREIRSCAEPALPLDWSPAPLLTGRAGAFAALHHVAHAVASGDMQAALVGAVDSYCDHESLLALQEQGKVLGHDNPAGLLPGEGAGFVLLVATARPRWLGEPVYGRLCTAATVSETTPVEQRRPIDAIGLTQLFRRLLQSNHGLPRPDRLLSCQPSGDFWTRELASAYLRNSAVMPEPFIMSSIADSLGDAGAASAIIQLAMAFWHFRRPSRPDKRAILYGASDDGHMGGCIVEAVR